MARMTDKVPRSPGGRSRGGAAQRRAGRMLAFKVLYEVDIARHSPAEVFTRLAEAEHPHAEAEEFARALVRGTIRHQSDLDEHIRRFAPAWPLEQMAPVERTILRMGLYESLYEQDQVPTSVAINEAVEMAKRFGSDASSRFVNGVLGQAVRTLTNSETDPAIVGAPTEEPMPESGEPRGTQSNQGYREGGTSA